MSGIFGETLTFQQENGGEVRLVVFGDEKYARYETVDGYTAIYDQQGGWYCYADLHEGRFVSTGVPVTGPPPVGLARHLHETPGTRRDELLTFDRALLPPSAPASRAERLLTFGPSGGLLPGRRLSEGNVRGLTILITFPGEQTTVTRADVEGLLNGDNFSENGNFSSVNGYFRLVSTNRLNFTNTVIGPFQMSRPKLAYANQDGLLVPEAFQLALDAGVDLTQFDSLGQGIVDALCILYAGRTEYKGDLWPHNWVFRRQAGGVRTDLYIVSSMGRRPADLSIGTFCHEAGHLLCRFPDLYDYGDIEREGDPIKSAGIGSFCVMGSGNHLNDGKTPAPVSAYLRGLVGWCDSVVDLRQPGQYTAVQGDYNSLLKYGSETDTEYFLLENRTRAGLDAFLPASGLAVYHCDTRGSNEFQAGTPRQHYQCALLQADGHLDLEANLNLGDGGDLYGRVAGTALSHATRPATVRWSGVESGLTISDISEPGPEITFRVGQVVPAGAVVKGESAPARRIPDNRAAGASDVIRLAGAGTVRGLKVSIDITHPYIGDLKVELFSPTGRRALLHNRTGRDAHDLHLRFDSEPPSLLTPLVGGPVAGDWLLRVTDLAAQDIGTIDRWSLEITTGS